ncbi:hypothetical protein DPMN_153836 [Dreissena polymorpha]|uniref:Uncharacterized protein n=1 Tax=Dreissena polymorpha TaxID=45954 RepID=A0A9D4FLH8_DREPO|nr:hypothetical protein DPMN_153836 [Dreissena polymorpha]
MWEYPVNSPWRWFMVHNLDQMLDNENKLISSSIILKCSSDRVLYPRRDGYRDDNVLVCCRGAEGFLTTGTKGSHATSQEVTPT